MDPYCLIQIAAAGCIGYAIGNPTKAKEIVKKWMQPAEKKPKA